MARYADLVDMSDDDWNWHFDIVLRHAYLAMQLGGRVMRGDGGAMVFVASVSGITSAPRHAAYGAAKAGLMALVRSGAVELGPLGIRVNAVAPGIIRTDIHAAAGDPGRLERVAGSVPMGRAGDPDEVAAAVAWLMSDACPYATGATLRVAGGPVLLPVIHMRGIVGMVNIFPGEPKPIMPRMVRRFEVG